MGMCIYTHTRNDHTTRAHLHDLGNVSVSFSLVNTNINIFFDCYTLITPTTHLVSVFSACRIVMHSGQTQSSVGAASIWMQRKWYTRGHVSQLITTPSLWHNQQNWSVEDATAGNGVATGDCCCKQNSNNKMLYKQGSITITFTYTKCEFLTTVMTKFHVFWDVTHVNWQTATDVLEKHTASICRFILRLLYIEDRESTLLWHVSNYLSVDTTCIFIFVHYFIHMV